MYDFGRVLTAMVTPFDADLKVDYDKARKLARYLVDNGSDGLVVSGTTGESPTLTNDEKLELFRVVIDEVGDRAKIIAGTGNNDTLDSVAMSVEAEKVGVDGVMAVVPYYNKPPQEGMYQHFKAIAEAISIPIILYNIPGRAVATLAPETIVRLAEIDNVVALKEASGSLESATEIKRRVPEDFLIYSGEDTLLLPMLSIGCHGVISVASHVVGNEIQALIKAFLDGNREEATRMHLRLYKMFKGLFCATNPIPVKTAMNLMGFEAGGFRLPLTEASEAELKFVTELLKEFNKL